MDTRPEVSIEEAVLMCAIDRFVAAVFDDTDPDGYKFNLEDVRTFTLSLLMTWNAANGDGKLFMPRFNRMNELMEKASPEDVMAMNTQDFSAEKSIAIDASRGIQIPLVMALREITGLNVVEKKKNPKPMPDLSTGLGDVDSIVDNLLKNMKGKKVN